MNAPLVPQSDDEALRKRRRRNNIALGLVLAALVAIFYVLTIAKMGPAIFTQRDL
ncbi:MAG: hypothetical protein ACTHKD_16725 [Devosia sp.]|jgi:hypothetical protein|nr:hypothetical protein [Devosia sp.]